MNPSITMNLVITMTIFVAAGLAATIFSLASAHRRLSFFGHCGLPDPPHQGETSRTDQGQATTEYALVLLGAGLIALILITWATTGGAEGRIGQLFDSVIDTITSRI